MDQINTREIEFRGIRIDGDQWVYGYYFTTPLTIENFGTGYLGDGVKRRCISTNMGVVYAVIPETVGQFTNWHDINMKKVYEGDYLKVYDTLHNVSFSGYVSYANGSFVIVGDNGIIHYRWYDYSIEKIGDIHTNPGLLEVIPDE